MPLNGGSSFTIDINPIITCLPHTLFSGPPKAEAHFSFPLQAKSASAVYTARFHTLHPVMVDPKLAGREHLGTRFLLGPEQTHGICRRKTILSIVVIIALVQSLSYIVSWWNYKLRNPVISRNERVSHCLEDHLAALRGAGRLCRIGRDKRRQHGDSEARQKDLSPGNCFCSNREVLTHLRKNIHMLCWCVHVCVWGGDKLVYTIVYAHVCFSLWRPGINLNGHSSGTTTSIFPRTQWSQ